MQGRLENKYSVDIKNAGIADIAIRNDCKIFASGGWDGRYAHLVTTFSTYYGVTIVGYEYLDLRRVNP